MKKSLITILLLTAASLAFAEGKPQTTCPVMGGKINKQLYVDTNGFRIYICCEGCIGAIKAEPQKYIDKLTADGVEIGKTPQTTCPVMKGKKINPKLYVDAEGYRIYVCCGTCVKAVKADPAKYIKQMKAEGVNLEKLPTTKDDKSNADPMQHDQ
jgi:YHS domain-containing protein